MWHQVKSWADDQALRRLIRNAGTLVFGNAMQSTMGLVSLGISARALGPTDFGQLAIAVTYAAVITQLIGFQSWQAVIRYGTAALSEGRSHRFLGIVKAGLLLDVVAAIVASAVALAGVMFGAKLLGFNVESRAVGVLVSVGILANVVGTPTALLRIFDRYKLFVVQAFLTSLMKLFLVTLAFLAGGGLFAFAAAWVGSQVFGYVLLASFAIRELVRRQFPIRGGDGVLGVFRQYPDLGRFFMATNLSGTARTLRDLDIPLVGLLLGPSASGSFKIARQLAGALNKIIDPFHFAVYPDLNRFHTAGETGNALRLVRRSSLLLGSFASLGFLLFLLAGERMLVLVLGEEYRGAYLITTWCLAGAVIWAFAQPIAPMLLAYGRQSALLLINVITTAGYLMAVAAASSQLGLTAVGAVFAVYLLVWAMLCASLLVKTASGTVSISNITET